MRATAGRISMVLVLAATGVAFDPLAGAVSANVDGTGLVISQVYGGGGNPGATYTHDFVEIRNPTSSAVALDGWTVQYALPSGLFNPLAASLVTPLSGEIAAGGFVLVQGTAGLGGTTPLPTPVVTDATAIDLGPAAGKVRLADAAGTVVDLVGYGTTANAFEGSAPAPAPSNTTAIVRHRRGCDDRDDNRIDFTTANPRPRSSAEPPRACGMSLNDVTVAEGGPSAGSTLHFDVVLPEPAEADVGFTIATADGTAIGGEDYIAAARVSAVLPAGATSFPFDVQVVGDADPELDETFGVTITDVVGPVVFDGEATGTILNDDPPALSLGDASAPEASGALAFTVRLSVPALPGGVSFDVVTTDGTAVAPGDYTATTVTGQVIPAGATSAVITVPIVDDSVVEPDETFAVAVTNVVGATPLDVDAVGTIVNDDVQVDPCSLPFVPIPAIQGSGATAATTGTVTTQGVVVGDVDGSAAASGFYLQAVTGDGVAETSDGIFVYTGSADLVSAGQVVRVTGFARERFNQTTINGSDANNAAVPASDVLHCGGTVTIEPVEVTMPFPTSTYLERFEGMLVEFPQDLVIAEYFNYDQFGEIVLALPLEGEDRPYTPTAVVEPGAPAIARATANALRRITLDDAQSASNPPVLRHPNGDPFTLTNMFRGGDTVADAAGVLGYDFNLYRIVPTGPADFTPRNPRPVAPADPGGSVRAAAMNTLNFFITPDHPNTTPANPLDNKCGPLQNLECRGHDADQPLEFTRQRDKLISALAGLDADVIGLNELENTTGVDALSDPNGVVAGLNARLGAGTYAHIDTGVIGTDAIRVGIIYKPAEVTPVGRFAALTSAVDPRFIDTRSRPALAQTFEEVGTGARFTVAVNHLKSKGSACADIGDPDVGDGQGNCNVTRTQAAKALVDWLATDPTGSGDPDVLVLGDLNSYTMEDPIDAVRAGGDDALGTADDYTNLIAKYQGIDAYSYTFDGQAGYLDHALSSASLTPQVTGAADWHINSDEPDVVDYDTTFKPPSQEALYQPNPYRASDHDPVVVGLQLVAPNRAPAVDAGGPYVVDEGATVTLTATSTDPEGAALVVEWDLDGNGTFETTGATPAFSAAGLDGPSTSTVVVRVTDPGGLSATDETTVGIANVAPAVTLAGPSELAPTTPGTWTIAVTDPSVADTAAGFDVTIDWGDGSSDEVEGATATHAYQATGTYTVTVRAADKDGGSSSTSATVFVWASVGLTPDPCAAGRTALVVQGTASAETITVSKAGSGVQVHIGVTLAGRFAPTGRIIVRAGGGSDVVVLTVDRQAVIDGGDGADLLVAGDGPQVILGGAGSDLITSGGGRDIVVGGESSDVLVAGEGDDAVVAGTATADLLALCAAADSWNGPASYPDRVAAIATGLAPLADDGATDLAFGAGGRDWFAVRTAGRDRDQHDAGKTETIRVL